MFFKNSIFFSMLTLSFSSFCNQDNECGNNIQAQELTQLIINDSTQLRHHLTCDARLTRAATIKVKEMAESGWVIHSGANRRLRDQNFPLPDYYGIGMANQVEALAGGQESSVNVWAGFKGSKSHATHLLGKLKFYHEQDKIGVGFIKAPKSKHIYYWAVYLAKESKINELNLELGPIPSKGPTGVIFEKSNTNKINVKLIPSKK
ncbi:CAP domain-containing protein [Pseudoalteromonas sp. C2R02]|uniref:CAP domain-containing protein n=1 Tax=Pseudoalteromonas sp. C2R02 TaxID=2841565 RepID=UPI001C08B32D|nr:CAP domain-containing protein [Pseudoalteromonas sp. C2R02]MBU2967758.1 CAP domain-containing protein [Pseudoalteromonas sp. C2R02]